MITRIERLRVTYFQEKIKIEIFHFLHMINMHERTH